MFPLRDDTQSVSDRPPWHSISDILFGVRSHRRVPLLILSVVLLILFSGPSTLPSPQQFPPALQASGLIVVLDPAHGGTDSGARGQGGVAEKDIVLDLARIVRSELERNGFRVLLTRSDDSSPSYDDRAAIANAQRDVVFISLHVASTGAPNTVRAYYEQFAAPFPPAAAPPAPNSLPVWDEAQRPYVDASHRLADLTQTQLATNFSGSPVTSMGVPIRGLRSVAAPAIAIEISSVSVPDPSSLATSAAPLASAIVHALEAYRTPAVAN